MTPKGTLQINILGTTFSIQANEDSLYLDKVFRHYKDMVEQVKSTTDLKEEIKIAVLAGVMLADEVLKERRNATSKTDTIVNSAELAEAEKITLKLIKKLDQALKTEPKKNEPVQTAADAAAVPQEQTVQ